jgi:hypothetical protein
VSEKSSYNLSRMKRGLIVASILALVLTAWLIRHVYVVHSQSVRAGQARRDAGYEALLRQYRNDLHTGMTRDEVRSYLDAHHIEYGLAYYTEIGSQSYTVRIGEEPLNGFVCDKSLIYIAFHFSASLKVTSGSDILKEVEISKLGHCL